MARLIPFLLLALFSRMLQAQIPYFKKLEIYSEVNSLKVNTIFQDRQHFIWVGTSIGVYRYDGNRFFLIPGSDTMQNPSVSALFRDTSGRLWIGYHDGKIYHYHKNRLQAFAPEEGNPKVNITSFRQDSAGAIWISTYGEGVYYYDEKRLYNFNEEDGLPDNYVYTLACCINGNIWCGTDDGIAICGWNSGKKEIRQISQKNGLPDNIVRTLLATRDGKVWIGMQDAGLCYYDLATTRLEVPGNVKQWAYGGVTSICQLRENEIWVGTEKAGIVDVELFGSGRVRNFDRSHGLPSMRVNQVVLDAEGNIWIASGNELLFSPGEKIEFIRPTSGSMIYDIQALLFRKNGELWFSTPENLYFMNINNPVSAAIRTVLPKGKLDHSSILCMYEDPYGKIWMGTFGQGVYCYEPASGRLFSIRESDGLANDNVLSIDGKGADVWFATLGGVSRCSTVPAGYQDLKTYTQQNGLGENYVYHVFVDSRNRVWFATDGKGITVYQNDLFINYSSEVGIRSDVIYSITEDQGGRIWFSTLDAGLYAYNGKTFQNFSVAEGLSSTDVSSLKADHHGNLVVIHDNGFDVVQTATGKVLYYGAESGIVEINPNLNSSCMDEDGNIWIGTRSAIIKIHMPGEKAVTNPVTVLNDVQVFLNSIDEGAETRFPYNKNHVSFDFIGLYYSNPDMVAYEYRLDGYNPEWIRTRDHFITFPNLPPGSYSFKVRSALNNQFAGGETVMYSFQIQKAFWQQAWFYLLTTLTAGTLVIGVFKFRENELRRTEHAKKERIEFQFETLRSQVNPHFLFNSLNTVAALIDEDRKLAIEYVDKLADYYRSILSYKDVDLISLREEWQLALNFVYLARQRHGNSFRFEDENFEKRDDLYLPPLSLQMLIENALKHNVVSRDRPLTIRVSMKDEITMVVENDLQLKTSKPPSTRFGLQGISDRFQLLGGEPITVYETGDKYIVELKLLKRISNENSHHRR